MKTITLKIEDDIFEKVLSLLKKFSTKKIKIIEHQSDDEYLKSIKGMEKSIIDASNEPIQNYVTIDKLDW